MSNVAYLVGSALVASLAVPRIRDGVLTEIQVSALKRKTNAMDFLARTIYGEARGEGRPGMEAVAAVVMNRVKSPRYPNTVIEVVTQDRQFSCWNFGDPNRVKVLAATEADPAFALALDIAAAAISGTLLDRTFGSTHYHTRGVKPAWADPRKVAAIIGSHIYYSGIA